jgi:hypothetical protein
MGEIADMMLDGTMDSETGEWNFDGEDGPGFPMTGTEAANYSSATGWAPKRSSGIRKIIGHGTAAFKVNKALRKKVEAFGDLVRHDPYHWQVRKGGKVVADWWPHKSKYRIAGAQTTIGHPDAFLVALEAAQ